VEGHGGDRVDRKQRARWMSRVHALWCYPVMSRTEQMTCPDMSGPKNPNSRPSQRNRPSRHKEVEEGGGMHTDRWRQTGGGHRRSLPVHACGGPRQDDTSAWHAVVNV
jgi:hypothetical protein